MKELPAPDPRLASGLILWFEANGRDFPWRSESNPFLVLTAEILLQRTRADQVVPVYQEIRDKVTGPSDVLELGSDFVVSWFERLGLNWRAPLFLSLCRTLVSRYGGEVPSSHSELIELPGVGQYAAGATLNYAFGIPAGMLDSNILRIYRRFFGIEFSDSDRRRKSVLAWASELVPESPEEARMYNLGLVDLGADLCIPRAPRCEICPLRRLCSCALAGGGNPEPTR